MGYTTNEIRENEQGFTLVELAVVMIIIGVLIGGILKGQELITNARLTTTASTMESFSAAYNTFIDQYNAIPGDMGNATTRIGNCGSVTACTDSATSNGRLNVNVGAAASGEGINFFGQLVAADLIGGMDGSSVAPQLGVSNPTAPIGGGFLAGDNRTGDSTGALASALRPSPYITLTSDLNTVGGVGTVTDLQAATIDRRIDDGNPNAGMLISNNTATECVAAANAQTYSAANSLCVISYRMQ